MRNQSSPIRVRKNGPTQVTQKSSRRQPKSAGIPLAAERVFGQEPGLLLSLQQSPKLDVSRARKISSFLTTASRTCLRIGYGLSPGVARRSPLGSWRDSFPVRRQMRRQNIVGNEAGDLAARSRQNLSTMLAAILYCFRLLYLLGSGHRAVALENMAEIPPGTFPP